MMQNANFLGVQYGNDIYYQCAKRINVSTRFISKMDFEKQLHSYTGMTHWYGLNEFNAEFDCV